ncbi:MAG: AAA family ATPase [Hyphomonas sp.]|nr:AAA family ATPase [Hyphomonas sp.]
MKITNVTIENFLGIGEAVINLQDKGLVLVQGENLDDPSADSNGSGKSSMIDAIFWVLFGKTARGLGGDDVVNRVVGKQCIVSAELTDGTDTAVITRWRKAKGFHKRSGVTVTINGEDQSGGTDAITQAEINKVVGCSEQVFAAAVYAGQEAMPDVPSLTDRQLKSLIEEAAGIDMIETAYEIARENLRDLSGDQDDAKRKEDQARESVDRAERQIAAVEDEIEGWEKTRESRAKAATEEAGALKKRALDLKDDIQKFDIAGLNQQVADIEEQISTLDDQLLEVSQVIAGVSEEGEEQERLFQAALQSEKARDACKTEASRLARQFETHKAKYEDLANTVGDPCGECGKEITKADIGPAGKILKDKMAEIKSEHQDKRAEHEELAEAYEAADKVYQDFRANRTDISAQQAQQSKLTQKQRDLTSELSKLSATLSELPRLEEHYQQVKERFDEKRQQIKDLKEETNPHEKSRDRHKKDLADAKASVKAAAKVYSDASKKVVVAKAAVHVFGPKGVRAHILDTVTPFLNDRTAHYLATLSDGSMEAVWSTLTEGRDGELKEKFTIGVEKFGTGTFASLSGGEKRKVRLATTLALQDLVASRATKPIELWIGDEIDTALDPAGLERLMSLLEMKAREKGTVLIVSHHDLKDWVRDTVLVTMEGKAARVEGVLCPAP